MRFISNILLLILIPCQLFANAVTDANAIQQQVEINKLGVELADYRTQRKAYERLTQLAKHNQAAVIPMIELFRHKNADKGSTYETLRFINSFLLKYFRTETITPEVIAALIDSVEHCARHKCRWYGALSRLLLPVVRKHVLSEEQLSRMYAIAELYMEKVRKRQTTAYKATHIMEVVAQQGKYRSLSPEIKSLAKEFLDSQNKQARITGMKLFASQLYINDPLSRKIIYQLITGDSDRNLQVMTLGELTNWLKTTSSPNKDTRILILLYENKKATNIHDNLRRTFGQVIENPNLDSTIRAKLYDYATGNTGAGLEYLALENNASVLADRSLSNEEFNKLLNTFSVHNNDKLGHQALELIELQKQRYGLTQEGHHALMLVAVRNSKLLSNRQFYDLVFQSVPYSYLSSSDKPSYPQQIILQLIDEIVAADNYQAWSMGLQLLSKMTTLNTLNQDAIDRLYKVFVNIDNQSIRNLVVHQYLYPYYRNTGYLQFETLARLVDGGKFSEINILYQVYLEEIARGRVAEPRQKLLAYYNNENMPNQFRFVAARQLAILDFDFTQRHILPVYAGADENFVLGVWQQFNMVGQQYKKKVDKQLLMDATHHHNEYVRYLAWNMLKQHGVSTPLSVKLSQKSYRQDFYTGLIFFGGVPLSLIIGSLLFLKGRKGRKVKYEWTKTAMVFVWLISTVIVILLGAGLLFLAGLSHSGTPHKELDWGLSIIFGGYVLAAFITRLLIPTVPVNANQTQPAE